MGSPAIFLGRQPECGRLISLSVLYPVIRYCQAMIGCGQITLTVTKGEGMTGLENLIIRVMKADDLEAITAIDKRVLGKYRPEYWRMKMELLENRSSVASLVAEVDGKVAGFILGGASGWEYGVPETVGHIDTLGVDPEFQGRFLGRLLMKEIISHFRKVGVNKVYTYVNWREGDLLSFFNKAGFSRGDMINLEMKI